MIIFGKMFIIYRPVLDLKLAVIPYLAFCGLRRVEIESGQMATYLQKELSWGECWRSHPMWLGINKM